METESAVEIQTISKVVLTENLREPKKTPEDKYSLCFILFFLLGIVHILPISFPAAANNFWLYKFRNTSDLTESDDNRTPLQSYFASARSVVNTVPLLLWGIGNILYGHKFKLMSRIIFSFVVEALIFIIWTAFVKINTDSYQGPFFAIVLVCSAVLTAAIAVNILSSTLLYPKFPHRYMKICMMGEGVSGILSDLLNIISVALFDDVYDATMMYFLCGTFIIGATLALLFFVSRGKFFKHCLASFPEDLKKKKTSNREIISALKKIWSSIFMLLLYVTSLGLTHPAITSLVVSETNKDGAWSKKFFSPIATFLWSDFCLLIGRIASSYLPMQIPDSILCIYATINTIIFVPAIWFCNAKPRDHLAVLFSHDWEYILMMGIFMFGNGYAFNMAITSIPKKTAKEESEVAFNIFNLFVGIIQTISSPVGVVIVKLL